MAGDAADDSRAPMPAVFVGHGNPLNALNRESLLARRWRAIGEAMPRPRAIVAISAHWYIRETRVTAMDQPRTIHDFGGFPEELYQIQYPAPGDPDLASHLVGLLTPTNVELDYSWGLDHGTWSVLTHMFPAADIPVDQLSIDRGQPTSFHYDLAQRLSPLRDDGVLILGSGNLVHNLHTYSWGDHSGTAYPWALEFENEAKRLIAAHKHGRLIAYETMGEAALQSVPTPDHYLPFIYTIALCRGTESLSYPVEGFDGGSISMLMIQIG
jgi:4,5-DOPA dioxygenase extradiol